jgi:hypothetical protein
MKTYRIAPFLFVFATCALLGACQALSDLDDIEMADPASVTDGGAGADGHETESDVVEADGDAMVDLDIGVPDADAFEQIDVLSDGGEGWAFQESCVKPGAVQMQCDPRTNEGCGPGLACDVAKNGNGHYGFVCFGDGVAQEGEPCNGDKGPWCKAGLHCEPVAGKCTKFCCTPADCDESAPACGILDPFAIGTFGWCE